MGFVINTATERNGVDMEISWEIGKRIRYYRKEKDITQEKLAELCNLHPTYIGQLERGEKNATLESIYRIAQGLGVSMGRLFENIELLDDYSHNIPLDIYHRLSMLPHDKQQKVQNILAEIIGLAED